MKKNFTVPEAEQHNGLWLNTLCQCEVPEARQHIGLWSKAHSHCEERSDVAIARLVNCNGNAITTSNAAHSPRNDMAAVTHLTLLTFLT